MDLLALARVRAGQRRGGTACRTCASPYRAEIEALYDAGISLRVIAETLTHDAGFEIGPGAVRNHMDHRHTR